MLNAIIYITAQTCMYNLIGAQNIASNIHLRETLVRISGYYCMKLLKSDGHDAVVCIKNASEKS